MSKIISDIHLGRVFKNGVPLNRRGEREDRIFKKFKEAIETAESEEDIYILGDLFDTFIVPYELLIRTASVLNKALNRIVILAGNHDLSKDLTRISALYLLQRLCPHVICVFEPKVIAGQLFLPYSYTQTVEEQLSSITKPKDGFDAIYGHWDEPFSTKIAEYLSPTGVAYTGHIHKPNQVGRIKIVGSLEPLAHGEDPTDTLYQTVSLAEYLGQSENHWHDVCVRIRLEEGENLPETHNCLQLTAIRKGKELNPDGEAVEVSLAGLDIKQIIIEEIGPDMAEQIIDEYEELLACSNM